MKDWGKYLLKDSLVYGVGYGISRFLQIIILPIIAQALTLAEFGYYSNYVIFYTVTGGFLVLGLDSAVARFFYDSDNKKYHQQLFSSALIFIVFISLLTTFCFFLFSDVLLDVIGVPQAYEQALPYVLFSIPPLVLNSFFLSWFKWKRQKVCFLINSSATVIFLLIPLLLADKVTFYFVFQVICWSQIATTAISIPLAFNYMRPYFHKSLMIAMLKYGFPWMLVFVFGVSRTYLDRIFLNQYLSEETYGLYNFSVRVASILSMVITAFDMSFGPLAFSIWNKKEAPVFFARMQSIYIFLIASAACFITILSPILIQVLGGEKYRGAEKVLPFLLFAAICLSLVNFSSLGTSYAKKSFLSTTALFVGFSVVLLSNLLLTPYYLQYGAVFASVIGHLMIVATGYFLSRRYYAIPFNYGRDAFIYIFFFSLSVAAVNFPMVGNFYHRALIQSVILLIIIPLLLYFVFPQEYKKSQSLLKKLFFLSR
jgi:O-antigen/teichoic acid export membrane protein